MRIDAFEPSSASEWDEFVARCGNATFLHSRRFLSYHQDRFRDASIEVRLDEGQRLAVLPAAADPRDERRVVSHPGATYGGFVHQGALHGSRTLRAFAETAERFQRIGFAAWLYKPVPAIYHRSPSQDDLYALFRLGGRRVRADLAVAVELERRSTPSERRRRGLRRAERAGVRIEGGAACFGEFWAVLSANLRTRHGVEPVHSEAEIRLLADRFPSEIELVVARLDGELVGGTVVFHSANVAHAQYIAASETGREAGALDAVFEHCFAAAARRGERYFDFGISTEDGGRVLNEGLHDFKHEFGGGTTIYEAYELRL